MKLTSSHLSAFAGVLLSSGSTALTSPEWDVYGVDQGMPGPDVRAIAVATDGTVWLGFRGHGVVRMAGNSVSRYREGDGLVSDGVAALHVDFRGRIWAGGLGGYSIYEDERWHAHERVAGEISPRVVFSVSEPSAGITWLAFNGRRGTPGGR